MIDKQITEINFYKNGSAESVLKRYVFTQKEEKLVRDAIRTSKMDTPRMKLIYDADALLKEIAQTREPMTGIENIDNKELIKSIAKATAPDLSQKFFVWFRWWYILIFLAYIPFFNNPSDKEYKYGDTYSYEEALAYCEEQGKSFPLTVFDVKSVGSNIDTNKIWINNNSDFIKGVVDNDNYKKHVVCVERN